MIKIKIIVVLIWCSINQLFAQQNHTNKRSEYDWRWDIRSIPAVGFFPFGGAKFDDISLSTFVCGPSVDIYGREIITEDFTESILLGRNLDTDFFLKVIQLRQGQNFSTGWIFPSLFLGLLFCQIRTIINSKLMKRLYFTISFFFTIQLLIAQATKIVIYDFLIDDKTQQELPHIQGEKNLGVLLRNSINSLNCGVYAVDSVDFQKYPGKSPSISEVARVANHNAPFVSIVQITNNFTYPGRYSVRFFLFDIVNKKIIEEAIIKQTF
ncbi:MAG: hypothetical protein IPN76_20460 [Saprospiraceae bacterium]|nr:hypothetical protein [Saprospiraceae bacterium]